MKIGVLLYTYNRTDDARINMEIIRSAWKKSDLLKDVKIVHAFNGDKSWWPEKYLEDELLYLPNQGHFEGAEILLNEGVKEFSKKYPEVEYVIILAADTWLVLPEYIEKVLKEMKNEKKYLATSAWGTRIPFVWDSFWKIGMSIDFNIIDLQWSVTNNLFPLKLADFKEKYEQLFLYNGRLILPEKVFAMRFLQAISASEKIASDNDLFLIAERHIRRLKEREPVHTHFFSNSIHPKRKVYWKKIGLITHHNPVLKQRALKEWPIQLGAHGKRFVTSKDLKYFNRGLDAPK